VDDVFQAQVAALLPEQHFRAVCFSALQVQNTANAAFRRNIKVVAMEKEKLMTADTDTPPKCAASKSVDAAPEVSQPEDEAKRIRRLQIMISMVSSVISQDPSLTVEEASELAASAKRAALAMFPDKELAYDLLYKPRLQRLMRERFRLQ